MLSVRVVGYVVSLLLAGVLAADAGLASWQRDIPD